MWGPATLGNRVQGRATLNTVRMSWACSCAPTASCPVGSRARAVAHHGVHATCKRATARDVVGVQANGGPEVFEEYALVRALARRPERVGSKLLKKEYKMTRRSEAIKVQCTGGRAPRWGGTDG